MQAREYFQSIGVTDADIVAKACEWLSDKGTGMSLGQAGIHALAMQRNKEQE